MENQNYMSADPENDKNSIKTAGSINRTPKSTIASPGRIM